MQREKLYIDQSNQSEKPFPKNDVVYCDLRESRPAFAPLPHTENRIVLKQGIARRSLATL
jgi:hypothetical protein